jgi:hypothetical protein
MVDAVTVEITAGVRIGMGNAVGGVVGRRPGLFTVDVPSS